MKLETLLWLSLIPLTAYWLFAVDIYGHAPATVPAAISVLLGIAISIIGFLRAEVISHKGYTAAAIIPLALSCFVIPYPYNMGMIIASAALAVSLLAPEQRPLWLGALFSGVVLSTHTLALSIYYVIAPNYHRLDWLAPAVSSLANLIGLETSSNGGLLFVYAEKNVFPFTVTLEKLGFYPWILIFAGAIILVLLTSRGALQVLKRIGGVFILSVFYLLFRYLLLVHITYATDLPEYAADRMEPFINPLILLASFLPLLLLLLGLYPLQDARFDLRLNLERKQVIALVAVALSFFCLTAGAIYQDPGVRKEGRVLVDEIHSVWEFSTLRLDERWYGESSTYNAYSIIEWLGNTYDVDRIVSPSYESWSVQGATKVLPDIVSENITYDILKDYDILIIKTPSQYKAEEVDAIVHFVEDGGGLLVVGDHTNFAGSGTNLNQILSRFGMGLGFDSVNAMDGELYHFKRGLLPHPVVKYTPYLDFMTGCSISGPISSEPVILGFDLAAEPGEYASSGFFRETRYNDPTQMANTIWGLINQAVALKYGAGRVVVFSDSTVISNFRAFFGGTPNFIIGCMEYLNYKNSIEGGKEILLLIGIVLGAIAALILGRAAWGERRLMALIIILSLGSLLAGCALSSLSIKVEDSIPSQFYVKNSTVCFDGEHSDKIVTRGNISGNYETFFIWTQRVNLTPSLEDRFEDALEKGRFLVMIDPVRALSGDEVDELLEYVEDGNSVLLMLNTTGAGSDLAQSFGLDTYFIEEPPDARNITLSKDITHGLPMNPWGLAISGGKPALSVGGRVVVAESGHGRGKFVLVTDSHAFMDGFYGGPGYMGYSGSDPGVMDDLEYNLASLYNLEYRLFKEVLMPRLDGDIPHTIK